MRTTPLILALFVALLLAFGAWKLSSSDTAGGEGAVAPGAGASAPEALRPSGELPPAASGLQAAPAGAGRMEALAGPDAGVGDTDESGDDADEQRVVRGRVLDEFGTPIEGARIFLGRGEFGLPVDRRPGGFPGGEVEETLTGPEGRFELASSLRGEVQVAARAAGFAPLRVERELTGGEVAELADLVLVQGVRLRGFVVDGAGQGVAGVAIDPTPPRQGGFLLTFAGPPEDPLFRTGPDGSFEVDQLPAGPFELRLHHPDHPTLAVSGTVERAGETLSGLRYTLEDGHRIAGRVRGMSEGARLSVRSRPAGSEGFEPEGLLQQRMAEVGPDGSFELRGLREGRHSLQVVDGAERDPFAAERSTPVIASAGDRGVELDLRAGHGLRFRVVDDRTGEPVEDLRVEVGAPWMEPLRAEGGGRRESFPGGLVEVEDARVEPGRSVTRLRIVSERHAQLELDEVRLTAGEVTDLGDLRLTRVPELRVRVVEDASGEPLERATVRVTAVPDARPGQGGVRVGFAGGDLEVEEEGFDPFFGQREQRSGRTDEQGLAVLGSLPGQRVELAVSGRGHADHREELVLPTVDHAIEVRLKEGGAVRVTVLDAGGEPLAGARVRQRLDSDRPVGLAFPGAPGARGATRRTDDEGVVTFRHLEEGVHRFSLVEERDGGMVFGNASVMIGGGPGGPPKEGVTATVVEGEEQEVVLRAPARASVSGTVTENGQPLAGASVEFVEAGDAAEGMPGMLRMFGGGASPTTDSRGRYEVDGLRPGRHRVVISHPSRAMETSFEVEVAAGESGEDFALTVAVLEGRVTDEQGGPVPGVEVRAERAGPGVAARSVMMVSMISDGGGAMSISSGPRDPGTVRTDADGRYSLRGVEPGSPLVVRTRSEVHQPATSKEVEVADGQVRGGVDLTVFEAGRVIVRVVDSAGEPLGFCIVRLEWAGDPEQEVEDSRGFAAEGGETTLSSLRPGSWRATAERVAVTAGPEDTGSEPRRSEPVVVEVRPGETAEVTLRIEG